MFDRFIRKNLRQVVLKMTQEPASKRLKLENRHVSTIRPLIPPACLLEELAVTEQVAETVKIHAATEEKVELTLFRWIMLVNLSPISLKV